MHTGTSFSPVPPVANPTNRCIGKQCEGIFAATSMLYGRKAEVTLSDYFLEQRAPDVQSGVGGGMPAVRLLTQGGWGGALYSKSC